MMSPSTVLALNATPNTEAKALIAALMFVVVLLAALKSAFCATPSALCVTSESPIAMLAELPSTLTLHRPNTHTWIVSPAAVAA